MREPLEAAQRAGRPARYGVEAEIERLMRCPECGSDRVRQVREGVGRGYGIMGFKAIADFSAPKHVRCRNCGHEWDRPPLRELRREAERRIDERYAALDVENERLRRQLADYIAYQRDIDRGVISPPDEEPAPQQTAQSVADDADPPRPSDSPEGVPPVRSDPGN